MTNATEKSNKKTSLPTKRTKTLYLLKCDDTKFRLRKHSATAQGSSAICTEHGWVYQNREDAEKIAQKWSNSNRKLSVVEWHDEQAEKYFYGSPQEKQLAKKAIGVALNEAKNKQEILHLEMEFHNSGEFHYSILRETPEDFEKWAEQERISESSKALYYKFRPLYEAAEKEKSSVIDKLNDVSQEKEDLEAAPDTEKDAIVEELNLKHAFVHTDASYILTEKPHAFLRGVMDFVLESRQSFLHAYENQKVDSKNTKAHIWLSHPLRRSFPNGITFEPSTTGHTNGFYNLWGGFAYSPKQGSCELFKAHIQNVICSGNSSYFEYVWKWCAYVFQHPDRVHTALLLMGSQGTGKGVFVKALGALFGKHFIHLDSVERLVGNFNFHMKNAVLVFADEAVWGGNRKDVGRLKAMITEELALIEPKGKDSIPIRNFRHFIFSSNEDWPVHLDRDDRRFFVLKVSDGHKEDFNYFEGIAEELRNGGYSALLHELLNTDIVGYDPRQMPFNIDSFSVKLKSAPTSEQYLFEALRAGCFDIGNVSPSGEFPNGTILKSSLYTDYSCWCSRQGLKPEMQESFSKALLRTIPEVDTARSRQCSDNKSRKYVYIFPNLDESRKGFEKIFKVGPEIWE